jgi:Kelch motif
VNTTHLRSWSVMLFATLLAACGGGGGGKSPSPPAPQTIAFAQTGPLSAAVGTTVTNTASGGAGSGAISYVGSNTAVATVNASSGTAALVSVGTTTITASKAASTGFAAASATYTLTVTQGTQSISFAQAGPLNLLLASTTTNLTSGGPGAGAVTYASSNTNAITVDPTSGVATAVGVGSAVITATKAADTNYSQAQATYAVNSQTAGKISAFIGASGTDVVLPASANGKQFGRARVADCSAAGNVATCSNPELDPVNGAAIRDTRATLMTPAYYSIANGSTLGTPVDVRPDRFSGRIGMVSVYFNNRYWVIGGGEPVLPRAGNFLYVAKADVWSSADGKAWKLETADGGFGGRWFHRGVVFNNRIWIITGLQSSYPSFPAVPLYSDVWSSADGVNWRQETANAQLPWGTIDLNVIVFNGEMLAVSGGSIYSSTTGVFSQKAGSTTGVGGSIGRTHASLAIYNNQLWYIGGKPDQTLASPSGSGTNDVWNSADGVTWTQVTASAQFAPRYEHSSFAANGKLWVYGGETIVNGVMGHSLGDAWSTTDGMNWTQENVGGPVRGGLMGTVQEAGKVTLLGGGQVAFANTVWQSTDGANWSERSPYAQFSPRHTRGVEFKGQMWIAGGAAIDGSTTNFDTNEVWHSSDGLNWTRAVPNGATFSPRTGNAFVVFNNRLWVIGGWQDKINNVDGSEVYLNDVWSSADGANWRQEKASAEFSARVAPGVSVFAGKLWVIGGLAASGEVNDVWSSTDGVSWNRESAGAEFPACSNPKVIAFNNSLWLIDGEIAGSGIDGVWSSTDAVHWTQQNAGVHFSARTRQAAEVFNGRLYVVGGVSDATYQSATSYNDVWSTADGVHWSEDTDHAAFSPRSLHTLINHNNELWVIGGFGVNFTNDVWRSSDGVNWRVGFSADITAP